MILMVNKIKKTNRAMPSQGQLALLPLILIKTHGSNRDTKTSIVQQKRHVSGILGGSQMNEQIAHPETWRIGKTAACVEQFGDQYRIYQRHTPMFFPIKGRLHQFIEGAQMSS
jgi:hypothetical protein